MNTEWPADREYVAGTWACFAVYIASIVALSWGADGGHIEGPALWAAALVPGAAIAAQLWVTLRQLSRMDEFMRALTAKRFLAAGMIACIVASTWGFLETYARAPHMPGWLIYPLFWGFFGVVTPFIRSTR
ncbi:MAG TPA: hypothetical protein VF559_01525 [Caulobacteraceae bacterium]|jgi:hypothetical protein